MSSDTLLRTKLYIPPPRPNLVRRPRLSKRLNEGIGHDQGFARKLTLVSAPAGFGKTTLIADWGLDISQTTGPQSSIRRAKLCWLSLDEGDNDPARFLTYLVAALQTAVPPVGENTAAMLQASQSPSIESILTTLLNEITAVSHPIILVLDDYHVIDARPVDQALTFLLQHLPPQMHLVIATREDPPLPLARYRARGRLTELRAADLRFTPGEAAEFLNRVMGLGLSAEEIAALESRTEGWIAGLQMAGLALQGPFSRQAEADATEFIHAFTGSHRFVLDYLVEEVLQRQPERIRRFLLQTSILDRLSGPLCDAVTAQEDGQERLEALERDNLFLVPLDDKRRWYRYHHLFADVLRAHLQDEQPDEIPDLHRRASRWYEDNGRLPDAIQHALAAEDFERAANMIELIWPSVEESYQSATWLGWVQALPDELVGARPVLSVQYANELLGSGKMEAAEARLQDAERWLEATAEVSEMVVVDEAQFRSLPATIAIARAYRAQALGDIPNTVAQAQRVLELAADADHFNRGRANALLGLTYWASGDLEAANRSFTDFTQHLLRAGEIRDAISTAFVLADIRMVLGRLHEAKRVLEQVLQLAAEQEETTPLEAADLYRGLSALYLEWNELEAAAQYLSKGKALGERTPLLDWQRRLGVTQARLKQIEGDLDGALASLDEAERRHVRTPLPDARPIAAIKTRIWIRQGRLTEAMGWAQERGLSADDQLGYLREFEHITLARVLLARYQRERREDSLREAIGLLERLLRAAKEGKRKGSAIEILILQALAYQTQNDVPRALVSLEEALSLAEPEGYVRIFVDEGAPMAALLQEAAQRGLAANYVRQLQAALGKDEGETAVADHLIEPLTERELEVLRLLGTELNGPEIARELTVALSTMRTHTQNIYSKLGVNSRRTAVRRAEELDLL